MQSQSASRVLTFSIGFEDPSFDEARHAAAVAKHLGTEHTELYVTPRETLDVIPRLPALFDEPFADASQIPSFLVAQLARRHVSVALSGDGGDELFYGYRRFVDAKRLSQLVRPVPRAGRAVGATALRSAARAIVAVGGLRSRTVRRVAHRMHKAASLLSSASERELYWDVLSHWRRDEAIVPRTTGGSPQFIGTAGEPLDFDAWMMYQDMVAFLPDDVLVKVDRTSMGVSLETRAPLLDHRIVEFAWRVPMQCKYRDGRGKWLLRQVLYRYVPKHLVDRPKMGFEVPVAQWLRGDLRHVDGEAQVDGSRDGKAELAVLPLGRSDVPGMAGRATPRGSVSDEGRSGREAPCEHVSAGNARERAIIDRSPRFRGRIRGPMLAAFARQWIALIAFALCACATAPPIVSSPMPAADPDVHVDRPLSIGDVVVIDYFPSALLEGAP